MSFLFGGIGTISYAVKSNLITGSDNNVVSLTKSLNLYQKIRFMKAENVRIKRLKVVYKPRTGPIGTGNIEAWVRDNRIDGDITDPVINRCEFSATENAVITWESSVWLAKSDLDNTDNPPLVFGMELSSCNMNPGFSIGKITIIVEITASETMDRFLYKAPTLTVGQDPLLIRSKSIGSGFITKRTGTSIQGKEQGPDGQFESRKIEDVPNKARLRGVAKSSLGSQSARFPKRMIGMHNP
ncbi:TPA_asm: P3 [Artemisia alphacytorhabdovirus 3]|nr:TPA_asm: P3 [Artemisia alphacytorhabdovirus 3]